MTINKHVKLIKMINGNPKELFSLKYIQSSLHHVQFYANLTCRLSLNGNFFFIVHATEFFLHKKSSDRRCRKELKSFHNVTEFSALIPDNNFFPFYTVSCTRRLTLTYFIRHTDYKHTEELPSLKCHVKICF